MPDGLAIETTDLRKVYAGVEALRGVDLAVPAGSIFGFLGRGRQDDNTQGAARHDPADRRFRASPGPARRRSRVERSHPPRAAFVSEDKAIDGAMTVSDLIRFTAAFYPPWSRDLETRYLRRFEIPATQRVRTLSAGTRAKLALLLALCRGAELLLLDEPTSGLDPSSTDDVLQALVSHVAPDGITVFLSSHQLADVEQIADHVAIIERGRVAVAGALDDLRAANCRIQAVFDRAAPSDVFTGPGVARVDTTGRVVTAWSSAAPERLVAVARARGAVSVDVFPVTLKELFLETVREEP